MGFFEWFRDQLVFRPFAGGDDEYPNYKAVGRVLGSSLDSLGERSVVVRNEFTPDFCADERVEAHAQERGIERAPNETDAQYRANTQDAYAYYWPVGRDAAIRKAIERITDVPFDVAYIGNQAWKLGVDGWGTSPFNASGLKFAIIVKFMAHIDDDTKAAVNASIESFGKAARDIVYYDIPSLPAGILRMGVGAFGVDSFGPLWFDLDSTRYYLSDSVKNGATASTDSEDVDNPLSNLFAYNQGTFWQSDSATSAWLKLQLSPGSRYAAHLALLDHNLSNSATITLEAHTSDSWGSPAYSQAITWTEEHIVFTVGQTYQWWRLVISDPTNTDGYLTASTLHLGTVNTVS